MVVKFNNRARWSRKKGDYDYYDWEVYVDEDPAFLNKIDHVIYFLHKTYPNPIRTVTNPDNNFAIKSRGWGEFEIGIQIVYKDQGTDQMSYWLDLSKNWDS